MNCLYGCRLTGVSKAILRAGWAFALMLMAIGLPGAHAQILERVWARFLPRCESYAVSSDGSVCVSAGWDGAVQAYAEDGRVLWRTRFPSRVTCIPANRSLLYVVYSPGSQTCRKVYLLDGHGHTMRVETAPGAVRSVAVADDGSEAVILSEPARVTVVRRSGKGWRWQRTLLSGTVTSLSINSSGSLIAVGLRNPSRIVLLTRSLQTFWRFNGGVSGEFRVQMSPDGKRLSALSVASPDGLARAMYWHTSTPEPVWRKSLTGDLVHMYLSPDSEYLAAGYRTRLWHGRKSVVESQVTLCSNSGQRLWVVGGLMFPAHLIGATPNPTLILTHDNARVLAALDSEGHMRARHRLISSIRSCEMARGGRHFAVLTEAKVLYLFRLR